MKAIIIGAGIGGIASAVRLAIKGYSVEVFEANSYAGGKLHSFEQDGFRFDGGPSLFTMPHYLDELFKAAGKNPLDYFDYSEQETACHYFWEDGVQLKGYSDPDRFAAEAEQKLRFPQSELLEYFTHTKNIYDNSGKIFLEKSLHKASTWLTTDTLKSLLKTRQFDIFKTMNRANKIRLGEPHLVQLFNRFATYNGSDPYRAPGILNVIPWLEHGFGTFYPHGGMKQIPASLEKLARDLGVVFHFNTPVESIIIENGKAIGISAAGKTHKADVTVSNSDVWFTYRKLMPTQKAPERVLNQERSSSALVFYWGINKTFESLGLHNIFFSENYKQEFETMFNEDTVSDDVTVYVNISSKCDPTDAPAGCENWFVMVNVPSDNGQDWEALQKRVRQQVVKKLGRILKTDLEKAIVTQRTWNPVGIEEDTRSYKGSLYGTSSNDQFAAFLRHPNFSSKIDNLYFCGGSVHPGGGIPLALLSAKITTEMVTA